MVRFQTWDQSPCITNFELTTQTPTNPKLSLAWVLALVSVAGMLVLLSVILQDDGVCISSDSLDKIYSSVLHTPDVVCQPVPHQPQNLYRLYSIAHQWFPDYAETESFGWNIQCNNVWTVWFLKCYLNFALQLRKLSKSGVSYRRYWCLHSSDYAHRKSFLQPECMQ